MNAWYRQIHRDRKQIISYQAGREKVKWRCCLMGAEFSFGGMKMF